MLWKNIYSCKVAFSCKKRRVSKRILPTNGGELKWLEWTETKAKVRLIACLNLPMMLLWLAFWLVGERSSYRKRIVRHKRSKFR